MPWAVDFLPSHIMELTNFVTSDELYTGSAATSRFAICPFLGIENLVFPSAKSWCYLAPLFCPAFGALGAVLGTALLTIGHTHGIEGAANHVVADTRQILYTAAADKHDRVLLQVVANSGNVGSDFHAVGEADARDLAQRGVRLLGRLRIDAGADAAPLRRSLQCRRRRLVPGRGPAFSHELTKCGQSLTP